MADKVTLTQDYDTVGKTDYATDMNADNLATETSLNALIDEFDASSIPSQAISSDILQSRDHSAVRYTQQSARVLQDDTADTIEVKAGLIFVGGARILVTGATFDYTGLGAATYYIAVDAAGLLYSSTTPANKSFDLVTIVWSGAAFTTVTDNLWNDGFSSRASDQGYAQQLDRDANSANYDTSTIDFNSAAYPDRLNPPIGRWISYDGATVGEAGFFPASQDEYGWVSELDGSAATVLAGQLSSQGQVQLFEQSRLMLTYSSGSAGSGSLSALTMASARQEPASYNASSVPWGSTPAATFNVPNDTQFAGTYQVSGFVEFNAAATGEVAAQITVGGTVIAYGRAAIPTARTPVISLSGLVDAAANDAVQILAEVGGGTATITSARLGMHLIGGRATP